MPGLTADEESKTNRLKSALWFAVGHAVDTICLTQGINATPQFIAALSEMTYGQIENVARDLEAFSKHDGRSIINVKDVQLLGRRNEGLDHFLTIHTEQIRRANDN